MDKYIVITSQSFMLLHCCAVAVRAKNGWLADMSGIFSKCQTDLHQTQKCTKCLTFVKQVTNGFVINVVVITYPCFKLNAGLAYLCKIGLRNNIPYLFCSNLCKWI